MEERWENTQKKAFSEMNVVVQGENPFILYWLA